MIADLSPTASPKPTFLIIEMKFNVQKEISLNCKTQDIWYGGGGRGVTSYNELGNT
jgi:hypothetical protein